MKVRCGGCFHMYDDAFEICPDCGYYEGKPAKEPYQLVPGTVLENRYVIGNVLGFGGFGVTYKAWDKKLESVVCIKEYYPSGIVNRPPGTSKLILFSGVKKKEFEYGLVRFIDEARNMTKFNAHKNIVNVYEYFEENNTAYIVMEFLDGCTLSEYMEANEGGRIPLDRSLEIIMAVGNALKDVHENGIIHRDVSPDNIFMCNDGTIKLIDFGAARFSSEEAKNFTIILKPGFAPPEQYEQISDQGPKTDIYALGATLYYMLTGVKPDESTNRKIKDVLEEPNKLVPELPQHINDSVLKAMAIEPHLRFESVEEFEKSLRQEIKVTSLKKEKRTKKTKRLLGILSLLLVLSAAATVFFANMQKKRENVTLKPASIEMWAVADKGTEAAKYDEIVEQFMKSYPGVKVQLTVYPAAEYDAKLAEAAAAGKLPHLFVSTGLSFNDLTKTNDLSSVIFPDDNKLYFLINLLKKNDCYFLDDYETLFPEHKQIPTSFNLPVIYVNEKLAQGFGKTEIASMDDLKDFLTDGKRLVYNANLQQEFNDLFHAGESAQIVKGTVEQFIQGQAAFYFSDTSEFFACRELTKSGDSTVAILPVSSKRLPAAFHTLWSVAGANADQNAAAYRLLAFLLTENGQLRMMRESDMEHALPVNREALKFLTDPERYSDLSFVSGQVKDAVFPDHENK